ncbi:hypothetical protein ASG74_09665 [Knoellia sp. Soil729]|nr:hypothetical protein ASG74_09665 [Knoellia sp. Soil729]
MVADRLMGMDEIAIRDGVPAAQVASLVSWLASVEPEGVDERQRLEAVSALEALKGAAAAAQARLTAAAVVDRKALGEDSRSVRAPDGGRPARGGGEDAGVGDAADDGRAHAWGDQ